MFQGKKRTFENFINYWEEEKFEGAAKSDSYRKMIAKMFLNNAFGKFVSRNNRIPCSYKKTDDGEVIKTIYTGGERFTGRSIYCPFGCYITSYGRKLWLKLVKQNLDTFVYGDTDSGHFLVDDIRKLNLQGLDIDESRFGALKIENEWEEALFLGKKQYIEKNIDGSMKIVCAGLPVQIATQENFKKVEDFHFGRELEYEIERYTEEGELISCKNNYLLKNEQIL